MFFKGCSLHCPWCANPENISFDIQKYYDEEKNTNGIYGYEISLDNLYDQIIKDKDFYENEGGVTFSGGEPLLKVSDIVELLKKLKNEKVNICFETSLFVPIDSLKTAINYANEFIVDLKILDKEDCQDILGGNLDLYLSNLKYLFENFDVSRITIRIPVTNEYVLKNADKYVELLKKYKPNKVEIFKLHNLAEKKYKTLNKTMKKYSLIDDNELNDFKNKLNKFCKVEILNY